MAEFKDFLSNTRKGETFVGAYDCQFCDAYVSEALYDREAKTLTWVCENDHLSRIEEFNFG